MSAECSHEWETCPVHGAPGGEFPGMSTVLLCVYGGVETKDGRPFGASDAEAVAGRVFDRLWGDDDG